MDTTLVKLLAKILDVINEREAYIKKMVNRMQH
jgi:hypothetical protein